MPLSTRKLGGAFRKDSESTCMVTDVAFLWSVLYVCAHVQCMYAYVRGEGSSCNITITRGGRRGHPSTILDFSLTIFGRICKSSMYPLVQV